jgi:hypothetical protein
MKMTEQLKLLEELSCLIVNTLALTAVGIGSEMHDYEPVIIHEYFGAIDSLQQKAQLLCIQIIDNFYQPISENINVENFLDETQKDDLEET